MISAACGSLSCTACPEAEWRCLLLPPWSQKEQEGGTPHRRQCNWWIKGPGLAQMDSGGPPAHGGPRLEAGQLWILQRRPGPHPHKTIPRKKREAQSPSFCGIRKDQQNSLNGFKVSRSLFPPLSFLFLFFSSPKWDNKSGVVKGPETDAKVEYKANPKTEKLRQISLRYPIELAFYCLFVLLFHYFYLFYFVSFLFLFFLFSFLHFISMFNCIVWPFFLILSLILYFNFPSFISLLFQ